MRTFKKALFFAIVLGVVAGCGGMFGTLVYYRQVAEEVEQAFATYRWAVPSRVYSDRLALYAGLNVEKQGLLPRLERMGYRKENNVAAPGEYSQSPTLLEIYQRPLAHPTFGHPARRVRITLAGKIIVRLETDDSTEPQPILFLEPETLAVLVGDTWQNRELVRVEDMPAAMTQAVVAIEDRRFFKHAGLDPQGILRALIKDVLEMRLAEGGSTLTQQVVKNIILKDHGKKFSRKYKEMVMAYVIDREYAKNEILAKYLNEIYFGQDGAYEVRGVGAAARFYFGKPIEELSVTECATLAGVIHAPNRYSKSGIPQPKALTARRNQVLEAMYQTGYLTEAELSRYKLEPPALREARAPRRLAPYFVDLLQRQLQTEYSTDGLTQEGLSIYTTLQMQLQLAAEKAVSENLARLEKTYSRLRRSDPQQQLQAAVVLLRPATGEIVALVGGRDYKSTQYDRIHRALRQPGSLIKPFVYLAALSEPADSGVFPGGFHALYPLRDSETTFNYHGVEYAPKNYDKKTRGLVPAYYALSRSLNIPAVQLISQLTPPRVAETVSAFGIQTPFRDLLPSALGVNEVYPIEMARAFGAIANGGVLAEPRIFSNVVDHSGTLLEHTPLRMMEASSPQSTAILISMLQEAVNHGTARAIRAAGIDVPLAGKTGTTDDGKDAWFVGFAPEILGLVWVGFDDGTPLNLTGGSAALPVWLDIFKAMDLSGEEFPLPDSVEEIDVDPQGAGQAVAGCPANRLIKLTFVTDRMPMGCMLHSPQPVTAPVIAPLE
jgi:penicillin-binding protein 1B